MQLQRKFNFKTNNQMNKNQNTIQSQLRTNDCKLHQSSMAIAMRDATYQ